MFCTASVALVLAVYKYGFNLPRAFSVLLTHLGMMTYGVYLLHPLVYAAMLWALNKLDIEPCPYTVITLTMITTILAAQASFTLLEKPIMGLGKRMTAIPQHASSSLTPIAQQKPTHFFGSLRESVEICLPHGNF